MAEGFRGNFLHLQFNKTQRSEEKYFCLHPTLGKPYLALESNWTIERVLHILRWTNKVGYKFMELYKTIHFAFPARKVPLLSVSFHFFKKVKNLIKVILKIHFKTYLWFYSQLPLIDGAFVQDKPFVANSIIPRHSLFSIIKNRCTFLNQEIWN